MQLRLLFILTICILIIGCSKDKCGACNSELITEFVWNQRVGNNIRDTIGNTFYINYDDSDRISSINQKGFIRIGDIDQNRRYVSENITYFYEDDELKSAIADVTEIKGEFLISPITFKGLVHKRFVKETSPSRTIIYEIVDSVETEPEYSYSNDTISYSFANTGNLGIYEYATKVKTVYSFLDNNVYECITDTEPYDYYNNFFRISFIEYSFGEDSNPFKIINDKLGYTKFRDIQFISSNTYIDRSYGPTPGGSGMGSPDIIGLPPEYDCHDDVVKIGEEYLIIEKLCR